MNVVRKLYLITLVSLFAACEGNTDYYFHATNSTNETIKLTVSNIQSADTSFSIAPGAKVKLLQTSQLGGLNSEVDPTSYFSLLKGQKANGDTVVSDLLNRSNWEGIVLERKKVPADFTHYYTLNIEEGDF